MKKIAMTALLLVAAIVAAAQPTVTVRWNSTVAPAGDDHTFEITCTG